MSPIRKVAPMLNPPDQQVDKRMEDVCRRIENSTETLRRLDDDQDEDVDPRDAS